MPMERDAHEALLNELMNPEIEHTRRSDILQQLRVDYGTVITDHTEMTTQTEKLTAQNQDLVISNSMLFRQLGTNGISEKEKEKTVEKEFSQTITLEALEK